MQLAANPAAFIARRFGALGTLGTLSMLDMLRLVTATRQPPQWHGRAMPRGATWALDAAHEWQVQCLEGRLWITVDEQPQDHVLDGGEHQTVPTGLRQRVLVHALGDARVRVRAMH